jgi:hypothetical protein
MAQPSHRRRRCYADVAGRRSCRNAWPRKWRTAGGAVVRAGALIRFRPLTIVVSGPGNVGTLDTGGSEYPQAGPTAPEEPSYRNDSGRLVCLAFRTRTGCRRPGAGVLWQAGSAATGEAVLALRPNTTTATAPRQVRGLRLPAARQADAPAAGTRSHLGRQAALRPNSSASPRHRLLAGARRRGC